MLVGWVPPDPVDPLVPPLPLLPAPPLDEPLFPPTGSPPLPGPPPLSEAPPDPLAPPELPPARLRVRVGAHEAIPSASTHTSLSRNFWSAEWERPSIINLLRESLA
jgi:hypothetical protein